MALRSVRHHSIVMSAISGGFLLKEWVKPGVRNTPLLRFAQF